MINNTISRRNISRFIVDLKAGYIYYNLVLLNDPTIYPIKYRTIPHTTKAGNKSRIKIYFITKDEQDFIFDPDLKRQFIGFRRSYSISGI